MIKTLDENTARKFLGEQNFGHLGCTLEDGNPYVIPVNYLFIKNHIYFHSLPGKKIDALRKNGKICLQVEKIEDICWKSVIAFGEFYEIKQTNEKIDILLEFNKQFPQLTPVEAMNHADRTPDETIVFRINIKRLTGIAEI